MLEQNPDTHSTAVQASAAKTLLLLRKIYNEGNTLQPSLQDIGDVNSFISSYISPNPVASKDSVDKSISGIVKFTETIKQGQFLNARDFIDYLAAISTLVNTVNDHWNKNIYYSQEKQEYIEVESSLAETLNLVCLATLDKSAYIVDEKSSMDKDHFYRMETLVNCILHQPQQMCTAGKQHELIFLLNGVYCPKDSNGNLLSPLRLIEDFNDLLLTSINEKIIIEINNDFKDNEEGLFRLIRP